MAALYVVPAIARDRRPGQAGQRDRGEPLDRGLGVRRSLVNLLHVALLATFAFRYLSVAHEVPDAPVSGRARPPLADAADRLRARLNPLVDCAPPALRRRAHTLEDRQPGSPPTRTGPARGDPGGG